MASDTSLLGLAGVAPRTELDKAHLSPGEDTSFSSEVKEIASATQLGNNRP